MIMISSYFKDKCIGESGRVGLVRKRESIDLLCVCSQVGVWSQVGLKKNVCFSTNKVGHHVKLSWVSLRRTMWSSDTDGLSLNFTYESLNATLYHILQVLLAVWTSRDFVHNILRKRCSFVLPSHQENNVKDTILIIKIIIKKRSIQRLKIFVSLNLLFLSQGTTTALCVMPLIQKSWVSRHGMLSLVSAQVAEKVSVKQHLNRNLIYNLYTIQ